MARKMSLTAAAKKQAKKVDPITLSVIRGGLTTLCFEMGEVIEKASYSPIFTEGQDYSCAFFDGEGEEVAMHAFDPNHVACMRFAVEWSLAEIGIQVLEPGDVIFCNDPYRGGNHINDCTLFKPVFVRGGRRIAGFPAIRPHLIDLGGSVPGNFAGDATEIFQEGLRIPPLKICSRGKLNEEFMKMLLANVRDPRGIKGDLEAILGALNVAESRVLQLVQKYGMRTWEDCIAEIKNASKRFMRQAIKKIPKGTYKAEDFLDDDGISLKPLKIKLALTVKRGSIVADFEGSSKQSSGPINATYAVTAGHTTIGVLHCLGIKGEIGLNEGCFKPIKVLAPAGTVVNVDYPAPCMGGNVETAPRVADLVVAALSHAIPSENVKAACSDTTQTLTAGGTFSDSRAPWVHLQYWGGGQGARWNKDGNNGNIFFATNNKCQSAEVLEVTFPILFEDFSLVTDTGGPGKFRGGIGCRFAWRLVDREATLSCIADRVRFSPFGVFGGLPPGSLQCGHASCTRMKPTNADEFKHIPEISGAVSPSKWAKVRMKTGDVLESVITGGGGYGDPFERDPDLVLHDVIEGYVSIAEAVKQYGVQIDEKRLRVDLGATNILRTKRKQLSKNVIQPRRKHSRVPSRQ